MKIEGDMFYVASKVLNIAITQPEYNCPDPKPVIPFIVNVAFGCELYLKSMLANIPKDHRLDVLFGLLDKTTKDKIKSNPCIRAKDFDESLSNISMAFTDWRYLFQTLHKNGSLDLDLYFLQDFFESLKQTIEGKSNEH